MKKLIIYVIFCIILSEIANYTNSKILLVMSCIAYISFIIWIVRTYGKNNYE